MGRTKNLKIQSYLYGPETQTSCKISIEVGYVILLKNVFITSEKNQNESSE